MIQVHPDMEHGPAVQLIVPNDRIRPNGATTIITVDPNEAETLREQIHLAAYMVKYGVRP